MSIDYDISRTVEDQELPDGIADLRPRSRPEDYAGTGPGEDPHQQIELSGADFDGQELQVLVLPRQADEFVCGCCFLIHHRSQIRATGTLCADCP